MLNDKIIDAAQTIMKFQFKDSPQINGFQPINFKQNTQHFQQIKTDMVQILHRGSANSGHWFTVSTLNCEEGSVNIFDNSFNDLDQESKTQISSILKYEGKTIKFHKIPAQHQVGGTDCGLFAIAFAAALCFGLNPYKICFHQDKMRDHLLLCLQRILLHLIQNNSHKGMGKQTVCVVKGVLPHLKKRVCICYGETP